MIVVCLVINQCGVQRRDDPYCRRCLVAEQGNRFGPTEMTQCYSQARNVLNPAEAPAYHPRPLTSKYRGMASRDSDQELEPRTATVKRATKETSIHVILAVDGGQLDGLPSEAVGLDPDAPRKNAHSFQSSKTQYIDIDSGIGFLDHMFVLSTKAPSATQSIDQLTGCTR